MQKEIVIPTSDPQELLQLVAPRAFHFGDEGLAIQRALVSCLNDFVDLLEEHRDTIHELSDKEHDVTLLEWQLESNTLERFLVETTETYSEIYNETIVTKKYIIPNKDRQRDGVVTLLTDDKRKSCLARIHELEEVLHQELNNTIPGQRTNADLINSLRTRITAEEDYLTGITTIHNQHLGKLRQSDLENKQ